MPLSAFNGYFIPKSRLAETFVFPLFIEVAKKSNVTQNESLKRYEVR
jgi:hypothetical protein